MLQPYLFIAPTENQGRGVFTQEAIPARTVIEIAPVVVLSAADRLLLDQTRLHDYIFVWGSNQTECCMALGFIPMYNHSYSSNCEYEMDFDAECMYITTVRDIQANEQLFINYNGDWNNEKPVWFDVV
jgi:SET domain-containing protein